MLETLGPADLARRDRKLQLQAAPSPAAPAQHEHRKHGLLTCPTEGACFSYWSGTVADTLRADCLAECKSFAPPFPLRSNRQTPPMPVADSANRYNPLEYEEEVQEKNLD